MTRATITKSFSTVAVLIGLVSRRYVVLSYDDIGLWPRKILYNTVDVVLALDEDT